MDHAAATVVLDDITATTAIIRSSITVPQHKPIAPLQQSIRIWFEQTLGVPPAFAASADPPTKEEVSILREGFAAFYGANRDAVAAERLLSQTIVSWQRQPPDEQSGLYRVRGDCYMVRNIISTCVCNSRRFICVCVCVSF